MQDYAFDPGLLGLNPQPLPPARTWQPSGLGSPRTSRLVVPPGPPGGGIPVPVPSGSLGPSLLLGPPASDSSPSSGLPVPVSPLTLPSKIRPAGLLGANFQEVSAPSHCRHWLLAFVDGAKKPNVAVSGYGFSYQKAVHHFAGRGAIFFTFTNDKGRYLFAYEMLGGRHVIKLCTDGLQVSQTPNGAAPWTVHSAKQAGLGAVFTQPASVTASASGGQNMVNVLPLSHSVNGTWVEVSPQDPTGQQTKAPDLASALAIAKTVLATSGSGWTYFGLSDYNDGAAQTPGEPAGVAVMRYNGTQFQMLIQEGTQTSAPSGGGGTATLIGNTVKVMVSQSPHTTSYLSGTPTSNGLWWSNYTWIYVGNQPPAGLCPPNVTQANASGMLGAWVATQPNFWVWFPAGRLVSITGGDGNTYWVYSSMFVANGSASPSGLPAPTSAPASLGVSAVGQWVNAQPGYYVWVGPSTLTTVTSYTWLWVLLGLAAVGGVGYYLLD
jgi:hypothetical protein